MAGQLSPAETALIGELCRDFRRWAPQADDEPTLLRLLPGGYCNTTALIGNDSQCWVLRIAKQTAVSADACEREAQIQRLAAAAGIAPPLCFSDPRRGAMIMPYFHGRRDEPCDVPRLARLLRRIHALPLIGEHVHSPELLQRYRAGLSRGHPLEATLSPHEETLARAAATVKQAPALSPVLCHNDLLRANRLVCGRRLLALDWEYAAPGDPFFDLAVCASEMSAAAAMELLESYLQRPAGSEERERFTAQRVLYAAIEACWHAQGVPVGPTPEQLRKRLLAMLRGCAPMESGS